MSPLTRALDPTSIVIVGASDDPDKVGGRPLFYLSRFGFKGRVYPVNPKRSHVQGQLALRSVADVPEQPDLAIIALPAEGAVQAVDECAAKGTGTAIVMSGGFAEAGATGAERQSRIVASARAGQMRLVGPNSQGLANFGTGTIASFSTAFLEIEPADGPVAIISQSGIMSVVPYALLRQRGIGVRHTHAIGNGADVTLAELSLAVLQDPNVRLLLLYLETMPDPAAFARVAALARDRDVSIVALKTGRSPAGQAAARSHTAALASEDRVVEAFFRQHAVWRATDVHELVNAAELYLKGWRPRGRRLAAVSNSGATCVMVADAVNAHGLSLSPLSDATRSALQGRLPDFAHAQNPLDVTGALLTDSSLVGDTLALVAADDQVDLLFVGVPVAGRGYDVARIAGDAARVSRERGKPLVATSSVAAVRETFRSAGVPTFERDRDALAALSQLCEHRELQRRPKPTEAARVELAVPAAANRFLDEAQSLALVSEAGIAVVPWTLCRSREEVRQAFHLLGGAVVAKGCAPDLPHKSELGLVVLDLRSEGAALEAFDRLSARMTDIQVRGGGVLFASFVRGRRELALGGRVDPQFGPVILVGAGGTDVEAVDDIRILLPPFAASEVEEAIWQLRVARVLGAGRGVPASDVAAFCSMAVTLGGVMLANADRIAAIDLNPVLVGTAGQGALVADAVVECRGQATPESGDESKGHKA